MGINLNDRSINSGDITREQFEKKLGDVKQKQKDSALKIFDFFAGDDKTLSADEAKLAFAELEKLNTNNDDEVSKKEIKAGKNGTDYQKTLSEAGKSAVELFYSSIKGNTAVHLSKDNNGNAVVTTLDDKKTVTTNDDVFQETTYDRTTGKSQEQPKTPPKENKPEIKNDDIKKSFLKYITNSQDFDGELFGKNILDDYFGGETTQLKIINENGKVGIEYNGKMYNMRGSGADIRFEYDGEKGQGETLQEAILNTKSDDAVHKYHNHGEAINSGSTYDIATGTINHGTNKDAVSQVQTFASMLMNGNENSTLTLDKQRGKSESFDTTAEHIIKTIDSKDSEDKSDGEITMKELISYLKAAEKETKGLDDGQATGARKFAKGVDLDLKDLANIGAVFKKYDTSGNGKLNKEELQNLLDDLIKKKKSMSKLAKEANKYEYKGPDDKGKPSTPTTPSTNPQEPMNRTANRTRNQVTIDGIKNGQKVQYDYENGLRTVVKDGKEDLEGNIAEESDPTFGLGKKRFVYIKGLPIEVDAELINIKGDKDKTKRLVQVKDRNGSIRYYQVNQNDDKSYQLGNEQVKQGDKFVSRTDLTKDICSSLGIRGENIKLPENLTAEYDKKGKLVYKLNGRICNSNFARVAIMKANTGTEGLDDG